MKLLLDTHVVLWSVLQPEEISDAAMTAMSELDNDVYISAVSAFEISTKYSVGKLKLPAPPKLWLMPEVDRIGELAWLAVTERHALRAGNLPLHHRDPFDRLLIAQALDEDMTLVTRDRHLGGYSVSILAA
jgi:PIN domain nuclease of toxin-antitoxin system